MKIDKDVHHIVYIYITYIHMVRFQLPNEAIIFSSPWLKQGGHHF
jgi:hypothetical protein